MASISQLFNNLMELIGLRYYDKEESDANFASKSHTHNGYLTNHQDISGKVDKNQGSSNKSKNVVTDSNGYITTEAKPSIPTKTSDLTNDSGFLTEHQSLTGYVQTSDSRLSDARTPTSHTHTKSEISDFPSTMTPSSHSHGNVSNDGKIGSNSGKIVTTGTGGVLQASDSITKSMISDFPSSMSPTSHEHGTVDVKDNSAYTNIGSSANATQKTINDKINTALGNKANSNNVYSKSETYTQSEITTAISNAVSDLQLFEVVSSLPTSNIKANRLYLIVNGETITNNKYDIYLRVNNDWEQLDSLEFDISNFYNKGEVDTLLNGKVSTDDTRLSNARTPTSHTHGNISNTGTLSGKSQNVVTDSDGKITTEDKPNIPTKVSQLTNDSSFITESSVTTHNSSNSAHSTLFDGKANLNNPIEFIIGTQSDSTNVWTGTSTQMSSLVSGTVIFYKLPYASTSSNVTLNITLNTGTKTGAKAVYFTNTTRVKTQYGVNAIICLMYDGSGWRVINPYTDNNTNYYDRNRFQTTGVYIKTAFTDDYGLLCGDDTGYWRLGSGSTFSLSHPILYYASATDMEAETYTTNGYTNYANVDASYIKTSPSFTVNKMVYLVGTVSNNTFTVDSSIITQTPNSTGKVYFPLGLAISETNIIFYPIYELVTYNGSNLVPYLPSHTHTTSEISNFPSTMTPSSHSHGDITNDGKLGTTSGKPLITTTGGKITTGAFGTSSGQFAEGNHSHSNYLTSTNISGMLTTSDVKDNLTSTDTNKPLSANQGKELKALVDGKASNGHTHEGTYQPVGNYLTSHNPVDSSLSTTSTNAVQNKVVKGALDNKLDKASSDTGFVKSNGTIVGFGTTTGKVAEGNHNHSGTYNKATYSQTLASGTNTYEIGKITVDGTATTIYGKDTNTTYSDATTSSSGLMSSTDKTKLDDIDTGANNYSHPSSHATTFITNSETYSNLGSSLTNQKLINDAINEKIGALLSVDLVEVVSSLGTASSSTMNKLYLVAESSGKTNDNYEIYVTVRTGSSGNYSYAWEKVDTARIDLTDYIKKTSTDTGFVKSNGNIVGYGTTTGTVSEGNHNHNGTYVDGVTGKNTTNGSALAEIKANSTVKGTVYHPKLLNSAVNNGFKKISVNTDGHITGTSNVDASDLPIHSHPYAWTEDESHIIYQDNSVVGVYTFGNSEEIAYDYNGGVIDSEKEGFFYLKNGSYVHFDDFIVEGDSRLDDSRTPTSHTHTTSEISNFPTLSNVATSGSYGDLSNKPSYTATVTSSDTNSYKIGSINISGSAVDIYGKDTNTVYTHPTKSGLSEQSTTTLKKVAYDNQGHITSTSDVSSSDLSSINGVEITDTTYSADESTLTLDSANNTFSIKSVPSHTHNYLTSNDITGKEDTSNKVKSDGSISSSSTDDQYASAKLIYNTLLKSDSTVKNGHTHSEYLTSSSLNGYLTKTSADGYYQAINTVPTHNHDSNYISKIANNTNIVLADGTNATLESKLETIVQNLINEANS